MSLPLDYRDYFIRGLHDALSGHMSSNVDEAVKYSEQSHTRCIGLTIETRPDYCLTPHLQQVWVLPSSYLAPHHVKHLWCMTVLNCISASYMSSVTPTCECISLDNVLHSSSAGHESS